MVIYTVTSRGLCCTDALSILHFAKLSDTSMDKISHLYQPLSLLPKKTAVLLTTATKWQGAVPKTAYTTQKHLLRNCLPTKIYSIRFSCNGSATKWHVFPFMFPFWQQRRNWGWMVCQNVWLQLGDHWVSTGSSKLWLSPNRKPNILKLPPI